jgi:hypothetical protein
MFSALHVNKETITSCFPTGNEFSFEQMCVRAGARQQIGYDHVEGEERGGVPANVQSNRGTENMILA